MERLDNDFFNETNPRSFINMVPEKLKELIKLVPDEFWDMTESEIVREIWGKDKKSAPVEWSKVRLALWKQYDIKVKSQYVSQIKSVDFIKGIFDSRRFFLELEVNPAKTRFIVVEPTEDWVRNEDILQLGIAEMREIMLTDPATNARTGVPAYELLKLKFEIFKYLDCRQNGEPVKKTQTESTNLNMNVEARTTDLKRFRSIAEIDAEIAKLEGESKPALVAAKPYIDPIMQMKPIDAERVLAREEKSYSDTE